MLIKKILWLSNCEYSQENIRTTGTWLISMMEALTNRKGVEITNVTFSNGRQFTKTQSGNIIQWKVPRKEFGKNGLPSEKAKVFFHELEAEFDPDLIHIWGTEDYWGMLAVNDVFKKPVLLDMQGVLSATGSSYYGGLTNSELFHCIGIKELILPKRHLYFKKKSLLKKSKLEKLIIEKINNISYQSDWVKSNLETYDIKNNYLYRTGILLRKAFYEAPAWERPIGMSPVLYTSTSWAIPYKGMHVLFRAIAILKNKYLHIKLNVGGSIGQTNRIKDGYASWLLKEAEKLKIADNIEWLGPLSDSEIIKNLLISNAVVIPSFIESYSLALAESMIIGVPTVVSFAGAMPELASHNKTALFFPINDHVSCSFQIDKLLSNDLLSKEISENARNTALERNNPELVVNNQLEIYKQVLNNAKDS